MDSRLKKALETQAVVDTAEALKAIVPRLDAIQAQLDRIEAQLKPQPNQGGKR